MGLKSKIQTTITVIAVLILNLFGSTAFAEVPVAGALTVTAANPSYTVTVSNPAYTEDYPGTNTNLYTLGSPLSVLSTSVTMSLSVTSANLNTGNVDVLLDGSLSPSGSMVYNPGTGLWSYSLTDSAAFTLGTHNLRSTFMDMNGGDGNTVPVTIRYDIVKADQTISFASMPDMPYGPTITLAATASSGLPVSYSIVGGTGTATISGNGLKPTLVGTIIVEAAQAGNNTYAAAAPVDQTINVIKASPVINLAAVTNLIYDGTPKTVTLSATPSSLLGAVVVTYNGSTTPPTAIGTYVVVATRPADANHNEATVSGVMNININRIIYRFYNVKNGTHFYTASIAERNNIMARWSSTYQYEGVAWKTTASSLPVYRFYNVKNGTHFYTVSAAEKANVIARWGSTYHYEGIGWVDSVSSPTIYRFYNVNTGTHFYTASAAEKANVIAKWPNIYKYEGIAW